MESLFNLAIMLWVVCYWIQSFLSYGTAYRYTKKGGDDGISLFGWLLVFNLAAIVPGLGIYYWNRIRCEDTGEERAPFAQDSRSQVVYVAGLASRQSSAGTRTGSTESVVFLASDGPVLTNVGSSPAIDSAVDNSVPSTNPICPSCGHILPRDSRFCEYCGASLGDNLTSEKMGE